MSPCAQPGSANAQWGGHRRMTPRIGAPHVGHKATRGGRRTIRVAMPSRGRACTLIRWESVGREGTAGLEQATVADFHAAVRAHALEDPAEKRERVAGGGAWACPPWPLL